MMLTQIFGSNIPSQVISSSGRELVIKFKTHVQEGPFHVKNDEAKFLIYYMIYSSGKNRFNLEMINIENYDT